ncbi:MAG: hypothetical protein ACYTE6_03895 [Planctomycetota bacterium]|jgi:hypothetical protein
MSKFGLVALIAVAGAAAVGWAIFNRPADGPASETMSDAPPSAAMPDSSPAADALVSINAIMEHPEEYHGVVRLEGVVAQVDGDRGLFMLMGRKDWAACGKSKCCVPLTLPVRGAEDLPAKETVVRVQGRVEQADGKYVLAAESVDRLEG